MGACMFQAFVGIIDQGGLACFSPEGRVSVTWLASRAATRRAEGAVCYRAVVSEETAREVRCELACHRPALALDILHGRAVELLAFETADLAPVTFTRSD
jgi:hypothetical protein